MTKECEKQVYTLLSGNRTLEDLRHSFEKLAPWYALFLSPWLPADKSALILDVPCGAGNLLYAPKKMGYFNARGYNSDVVQIGSAQDLLLPASEGDAEGALLEAPLGSVDMIFALDFLEHIPKEAAVNFCAAAYRALAPGGHLIARTPSADGPFASHDRYNDLTHAWAMTSNVAPYHWRNRIRLVLFGITTAVMGWCLNVCGIAPPRIWTRSMWVVARK